MKQKPINIKWLLILEAVVLYFTALNLLSHARGPAQYVDVDGESILSVQDFVPMSDIQGEAGQAAVHVRNSTAGTVAGYHAKLALLGKECLGVKFRIDCPTEFVGNTLIVDLYDDATGYDSPKQEQHIVLQSGINDIYIELEPGENAPEEGELRLFTVNTADYWIESIQVDEKIAQPKVTAPMVIAFILAAIVWLGTLFFDRWRKKNRTAQPR